MYCFSFIWKFIIVLGAKTSFCLLQSFIDTLYFRMCCSCYIITSIWMNFEGKFKWYMGIQSFLCLGKTKYLSSCWENQIRFMGSCTCCCLAGNELLGLVWASTCMRSSSLEDDYNLNKNEMNINSRLSKDSLVSKIEDENISPEFQIKEEKDSPKFLGNEWWNTGNKEEQAHKCPWWTQILFF